MSSLQKKYSDYFKVDETYFPQVTIDSIKQGEIQDPKFWTRTYPHEKFIDILKRLLDVLDGCGRSLWIYGSYGTGKSQCAYALRKILDPNVSDDELDYYWKKYETLREKTDLLTKFKAKRNEGNILTVYRYASSDIKSNKALFFRVQETVLRGLKDRKCRYTGENALVAGVLEWLEDESHKKIFDIFLRSKYSAKFAVGSANDVIKKLKNPNADNTDLITNILEVGEQEGIRPFDLSIQTLRKWLTDVIEMNNLKIVFIWDEFSEYFHQNRHSLTDFQTMVEMCNSGFFFIPVVHEFKSLFEDPNNFETKKLANRFHEEQIQLPDDIAFRLIGEAMTKKDAAAKDVWDNTIAPELNSLVASSRKAVASKAKLKQEGILRNILPIHPITALALKYIAVFFRSNQRSLFDFIKAPSGDNVKAFQAYIEEHGPQSQFLLLTIDRLWDFLEKGHDNLTPKVQSILDTYKRKGGDLTPGSLEEGLLKAVVIMQALEEASGGANDLFRATKENLHLAFEGIDGWDELKKIENTATRLCEKNILFFDKNTQTYAVDPGMGNIVGRVEKAKEKIEQELTTEKLIQEGGFDTLLDLTPPLKLRFTDNMSGSVKTTSESKLVATLSNLRSKINSSPGQFCVCLAFAHEAYEGNELRKKIAEQAEKFKDIVIIDATEVPLSDNHKADYIEFSACSLVHQLENQKFSREYDSKAKNALREWKREIQNGRFTVYWQGKRMNDCQNVTDVKTRLQQIVTEKFQHCFEFTRHITENQLKCTQAKASAKCGIEQKTSGIVVNLEKHLFQPGIWQVEGYWKKNEDDISVIKKAVEKYISNSFKKNGKVSLAEICDYLAKNYGFVRSNLYLFLTGFLLKEYVTTQYRFLGKAPEEMTSDRLSQGLNCCYTDNPKDRTSAGYILQQTPEEIEFYALTKKVWGIECETPAAAASSFSHVLRQRGFPLCCLKERVPEEVYSVAEKYRALCGLGGNEQLELIREIGKMSMNDRSLGNILRDAVTEEQFQDSARLFLQKFDNGNLWKYVSGVCAEDSVLTETRNRFDVQWQCLWDLSTQDGVFRELEEGFLFAYQTQNLFGNPCKSEKEACIQWRDQVNNWCNVSCQWIDENYPTLKPLLDLLKRLTQEDIYESDKIRCANKVLANDSELVRKIFVEKRGIFIKVYQSHIEGLDDSDISQVVSSLEKKMFLKSKNECYSLVANEAKKVLRNQVWNQLKNAWKSKTGTSDPKAWSEKFDIPIKCLVDSDKYSEAISAFEAILQPGKTESEMKEALEFFEKTELFDRINNQEYRNNRFTETFLQGGYCAVISVVDAQEEMKKTKVSAYDWLDDPNVRDALEKLAKKRYEAEGCQQALAIIDQMDVVAVKDYLTRLINENMHIGLEILSRENSK